MYKSVKKTKAIWRLMEALAIHTVEPTVHWEDNKSFISVVEARSFTPRVKHVVIPVWFLQEKSDNSLFVSKSDNYSAIPEDMFTKPCPGPIIGRSNK